jgi:hypothetical protein
LKIKDAKAEAAKAWQICGPDFKEHADACSFIAESTRKGDAFRTKVRRLSALQPDKVCYHCGCVSPSIFEEAEKKT